MAIDYKDINEQVRQIFLTDRLDIPGTTEIEMKFTVLSASNARKVIVDLSKVTFLASIGIRAIIANAKALQQRGGKMVLFVADNNMVSKTLITTGIDALVPMFEDIDSAMQALQE